MVVLPRTWLLPPPLNLSLEGVLSVDFELPSEGWDLAPLSFGDNFSLFGKFMSGD